MAAVHGSLGLSGWHLFEGFTLLFPFSHSSLSLIGLLASVEVKQQKLVCIVYRWYTQFHGHPWSPNKHARSDSDAFWLRSVMVIMASEQPECNRPATSFPLSDSIAFFHWRPGSYCAKPAGTWFGSGWLCQVLAKQIWSGSKSVCKNHLVNFWPKLPSRWNWPWLVYWADYIYQSKLTASSKLNTFSACNCLFTAYLNLILVFISE